MDLMLAQQWPERVPQRAEVCLVMPPLFQPVPENRLAHLAASDRVRETMGGGAFGFLSLLLLGAASLRRRLARLEH